MKKLNKKDVKTLINYNMTQVSHMLRMAHWYMRDANRLADEVGLEKESELLDDMQYWMHKLQMTGMSLSDNFEI